MTDFFRENIINITHVSSLRKILNKICIIFSSHENSTDDNLKPHNISLSFEQITEYKELTYYLFNSKFKEIIEKNLGNLNNLYFCEIKLQKNNRLFSAQNKVGFHQDSGKLGQNILINNKNNLYLKIGFFFQDNEYNYGGGIDVIKPTKFEKFFSGKLKFYVSVLMSLFRIKFFNNFINIKSGDIVGFSGTVFHRTSPIKINNLNNLSDKFVLYIQICNKNILNDIGIENEEIKKNLSQIEINNIKLNYFKNEKFVNKITKSLSD